MSDKLDLLLIEQRQHVRVLTLNRPARHHAINYELGCALAAAVEEAEADSETRVVIITGAGDKAFCAGQDMLEMSGAELPAGEVKSSSAAIAFERVAATPLPVIAAINGVCYGGGALLALACDIRLADFNSSYRFPGAEYGLVVGAAWLPRLVGTSKAKELIFTARKFTAEEALDCGFVSNLHPTQDVLGHALEMAEQISANSPIAVKESKRIIDLATLVAEAEVLEAEINQGLRGSREQKARFNTATHRVTGKKV